MGGQKSLLCTTLALYEDIKVSPKFTYLSMETFCHRFNTLLKSVYKRVPHLPATQIWKPQSRNLKHRINHNYKAMTRLSMDLKVIPIHESRSEEIGNVVIEHVLSKYRIPECMIMNLDSVFLSTLINYWLNKLGTPMLLVLNVINWYN